MDKEKINEIKKLIEKRKVNSQIIAHLTMLDIDGDADAQNLLGMAFYEMKKNYKIAKEYWEKSAKQGNNEAMEALGILYCNGDGVEKDYKKALDYFTKSANLGNVKALHDMGICYQHKLGVEQDYEEALKYFKLAASKGNTESLYNIGIFYRDGLGVEQNYETSMKYFKKAYEKGNTDALVEIAKIFEKGLGLFDKNVEFSIKCYEKAAEKGDVFALYKLGVIYKEGVLTKADFTKAKMYFEKLEEMKEPLAYFELGRMYKNGLGVEQNHQKALEYFEKWEFSTEDTYIRDIINDLNSRKIKTIKDVSELLETDIDETEYGAIRIIPEINAFCDSHTVYNIKDYKKIVAEIKDLLEDIEDLNEDKSNELEVFMKIYVKLGKKISYDYDVLDKKYTYVKENYTDRNLIGGLLQNKAVCAGYAEILRNVLACKNIESRMIVSEEHAYNQVKINGKWYYVDLTWDEDDIKEGEPIKNCLLSYENFSKKNSHINSVGEIAEDSIVDYSQTKVLETYNRILNQYNKNCQNDKLEIKTNGKQDLNTFFYRVASRMNKLFTREDEEK